MSLNTRCFLKAEHSVLSNSHPSVQEMKTLIDPRELNPCQSSGHDKHPYSALPSSPSCGTGIE